MEEKRTSLVGGIVGAFLGALIGGVLWILIYQLGYIAGLAGAVSLLCAFKGYELMGGKLDKKGVLISVVITLAVVFLSNRIAWALEAWKALGDEGWTFSDCFQELGYILEATELTTDYIKDLVVGILLSVVAGAKTALGTFKQVSQTQE